MSTKTRHTLTMLGVMLGALLAVVLTACQESTPGGTTSTNAPQVVEIARITPIAGGEPDAPDIRQ